MSITNSYQKINSNIVPVDANCNQILTARKWITTSFVLTGGKDRIHTPPGTYEVIIKNDTDVTFFETANTYNVDCLGTNIVCGTGYSGTNFVVPIYDNESFWLQGNGTVSLTYASIEKP